MKLPALLTAILFVASFSAASIALALSLIHILSLNGAAGGVCVHGGDGFVGGVLEKFCHGNAG